MTLVISLVPHIFLLNNKIIRLILFYWMLCISFTKIFAQAKDNETHFDGFHLNKIDSAEKWSYHFQLTGIAQGHTNFNSAYSGKNSIVDTGEIAVSLTSTLFLGRKLWKGAAIYVNPEIAGGKGMSYALGLAGAANGETFRIGSPEPKVYIARAFFQQHIKLKNSDKEFQEVVEKFTIGLTERPAFALANTKKLFRLSWSAELESQMENETEMIGQAGLTEDFAEGITAFIEKRKPKFK